MRHVHAAVRGRVRPRHRGCAFAALLCLMIMSIGGRAAPPLRADEVPAPLAPWWSWVLYGETDPDCPYLVANEARQCAWPGRLGIDVVDGGASFALDVAIRADTDLALPGRDGQWPQDVRADDTPLVVTARDGVPSVRLATGTYRITGRYTWATRPDTLQVPVDYGLVDLRIDGVDVTAPQRAPGGELWLQTPAATGADAEVDALTFHVYRRIVDEIPVQVETQIDLDVAGTPREIVLDGVLLAESVPMRLDAPLPARLDAAGRLLLQVRPGHWSIRVTARQPGPVSRLGRPAVDGAWPADEIWVFDARPALRVVDVQGGEAIDPRQTGLPAAWHALPAFRLAAGGALEFVEQRRGDPAPAPNRLSLTRELWLDFDGDGFSVRDTIAGELTRGWRLDAAAGLVPGRVLLNGEPQFITAFDGRHGVEVRRGAVDLRADSRIETITALNAVGWAHDFDRVTATLHLPPGWRLWSTRGVDDVSETWLQRWTLLDLFVVFIVALAVSRLWSWRLGALCVVALVLCWHETGAPRHVWLHVLAAIALVRVLPTGRLRTLATVYRNGALLVLIVLALGFTIEQVRLALYPQLELPAGVAAAGPPSLALPAPAPEMMREKSMLGSAASVTGAIDALEAGRGNQAAGRRVPDVRATYDPAATVQTGPGLPDWQWRATHLAWSGPVTATQPLELVLLSPPVNFALAILRVLALASLIGLLLRRVLAGASALHGAGALLLVAASLNAQAATDTPDAALLDELKRRALLPPACAPDCIALSRLGVAVVDDRLQLRLILHVQSPFGVPLPAQAEQGWPQTVIVDGAAAVGLRRDEAGRLLIALDAGVHDVVLDGGVPRRANFQIALPVPAQTTSIAAAGWAVDGPDRATTRASQLIFTRAATPGTRIDTAERTTALPPFFALERRLELGLDWRVHYRLVRVTPPGVGATLAIPLLDGEAVTTPGIDVVDAHATLVLAADEHERTWSTLLNRTERVTLRAAQTAQWTETWRADIAPIWHVDLAGIPLAHQRAEDGVWLPTWRPWPGEAATLVVTRPGGVAGRTLTIDRSDLELAPGRRASDATLSFTLRSSQGAQHVVELPADAQVQAVTLDDVAQPIRQDGRRVSLPVRPGEQRVVLRWRSPTAITAWFTTPSLSLGTDSVNARLALRLPADRWVLFAGGPGLGPAVLFWGTLAVVAIAGVVLGRSKLAPLPTWQWLLLGVGLTQCSIGGGVLVVGWLLAMGLRARLPSTLPAWRYNLIQVALVLLSIAALATLFEAIARGLLGQPSMQIAGNGSSAGELRWFVDRAGMRHPQAWVLSVPMWVYRGLMLAWALWLAFALLEWLRWGWRHFARDGVWRRVSFARASRSPDGA